MLRRWCIVLAMVALTTGAALTASSASAASASPASFSPGGPAHLVGFSATHQRGLSNQAERTN